MKNYSTLLLIAITLFGTGCQPSQDAVQTAIAQTQTFQYAIRAAISQTQMAQPTTMPSLVSTPPPTTTPACSVGIAGVMNYFNSYGYSKFSENAKQTGTSTLILNELDSNGYGRMVEIYYDGSCVIQIKAVVVDHVPPTDAEENLDSHFLATVTGAGLTDQQAAAILAWLNSSDHNNLLTGAQKNGKASDSVQLSPPSENPVAELTYELFPTKFQISYVIVFEDNIALDLATPISTPATPSPLCYSWEQVTKDFAGKIICVFGIVQSKYDGSAYSRDGSWNYRFVFKFSNKPSTFFIVDVNLDRFLNNWPLYGFPSLHIGDCVSLEGTVELSTDQTPLIKLGEGFNDCPVIPN